MGYGARVLIDRLRERQANDKRLGQHFLHDEAVLDDTIQLAELSDDDVVLEIGPGPGVLTERLLDSGIDLTCIELDEGACENLLEIFPSLNLVTGDALQVKWPIVNKIVANIPYQISSPLIEIITRQDRIGYVVMLLQEEFAERLVVKTVADRGSLGLCTALDWECEIVRRVAPNCFIPAPKINSSLVVMKRITPPSDSRFTKMLIRQAFSQRRKKLRNTLSKAPKRISRIKGWHAELYRDALQSIDSPLLEQRPEDLDLQQWQDLTKLFVDYKSSEG